MKPGHNYIGVGVGAMVFNQAGELFLAQRGPAARNERGTWEFPGGGVHFGETLKDAIVRELDEEYGIQIQIDQMLGVFDHILLAEQQHWIFITYIATHVAGTSQITGSQKCTAIGWFS